jgi:hypothetical protein
MLTGISGGGSPDAVAAEEELLHHPRPDEASCSRHANQLPLRLAIVVGHGIGRRKLLMDWHPIQINVPASNIYRVIRIHHVHKLAGLIIIMVDIFI